MLSPLNDSFVLSSMTSFSDSYISSYSYSTFCIFYGSNLELLEFMKCLAGGLTGFSFNGGTLPTFPLTFELCFTDAATSPTLEES